MLVRGKNVVLMPGGIREMLLSKKGTVDLYPSRMGFLKISQKLNKPVVPIYAMGEPNIFLTCQVLNDLRNLLISKVMYPFPTFLVGPFPGRFFFSPFFPDFQVVVVTLSQG
eukprot:TRINITY_DN3110_c0_g1_i1.p1 TRINITY_DN3110_c0_g1~~TRINITY_DN3110_c0_g1_i1.p1  ORF type:complete len:111 (+),score=20.81 TRINITY_DN3110_c0_g1_i1:539-871(+)